MLDEDEEPGAAGFRATRSVTRSVTRPRGKPGAGQLVAGGQVKQTA